MKILKVIHGYPPLYNAGSEVYTQILCQGLSEHHEVRVFTREENPFDNDYSLRLEPDYLNPAIVKYMVNIPGEKHHYRYRQEAVDRHFSNLLDAWKPDIVHIGHLNHVSTSLIYSCSTRQIPIVYTLHDFWLMCPRGQFIQRNVEQGNLWQLCDGQQNHKCATQCYSGYFSGSADERAEDVTYWEHWIGRRMAHIRDITNHIDVFIAPAKHLMTKFIADFGLSADRIKYLDYGFDLQRLGGRKREQETNVVFGYIGTHIPSKGIQLLLTAFSQLAGNSLLRIWGRDRAQNTAGLKMICQQFPESVQQRIEWKPEYRNEKIVSEVFNHVDAIVVPSIWEENSPLVIHEALQTRVPVITAATGGMSEYVHHEINGLLFSHRDPYSLASQLQRLADAPEYARQLGAKGYLQSHDGNIVDIKAHVHDITTIYEALLAKKGKTHGFSSRPLAHHI